MRCLCQVYRWGNELKKPKKLASRYSWKCLAQNLACKCSVSNSCCSSVGGTRVRKLYGTWGWATVPAVCLDSGLLAQEKQVSATIVWCHSYQRHLIYFFNLLRNAFCSLTFGCAGSLLLCGLWLWWSGLLLVAVRGLLIAVASLVEHKLSGSQTQELPGSSTGPVVVAHRLSYPTACGIFPRQGLNPCPLQ